MLTTKVKPLTESRSSTQPPKCIRTSVYIYASQPASQPDVGLADSMDQDILTLILALAKETKRILRYEMTRLDSFTQNAHKETVS